MNPLLFVPYFLSALAWAGAEFSSPAWEVTLFEGDERYRPGMAVIVGKSGYFTQSTGKKDCPGKDLFEFPITSGARGVNSVATVECVQSLSTDGENLIVTYRQGGSPGTAYLADGRLREVSEITITPEQEASHQARMNWVLEYTDLPRPDRNFTTFVGARMGLLRAAQGGYWIDLFRLRGGAAQQTPVYWPGKLADSGATTFFASGDGLSVFSLHQTGEFAVLRERRTEAAERPVSELTREISISPEREWPAGEWSVRLAQFYGALPRGCYVYEGSVHASALSGIYEYHRPSGRFSQVKIPSPKRLGGVSFSRGGFVISRSGSGVIQWYGSLREAFRLGTEVAVTDIRANPMVSEIESSDRSLQE